VTNELTVIYLSSNQEPESFEHKIQVRLLDIIGDLPLVSVTHKPMDFGHNICVGEIEVCDRSTRKQLLIGCEYATTPLVAIAEADTLYPPTGYFDFVPDNVDYAYRYMNIWVLERKPRFMRKWYIYWGMVAGREYLIGALKNWLQDSRQKDLWWKRSGWLPFEGEVPIISVKTGYGLRPNTRGTRGVPKVQHLPHWGSAVELKAELMDGISVR
jgi:hypothetical protein